MPDEEKVQLLREMHIERGMTIPKMAEQLEVDKNSISRWMDRLGVPRRRDNAPNERLQSIPEKERAELLRHMHWDMNWTMQEIADYFGVHRRAIINRFDRMGIKKRTIAEDNHRRYARMTPEQIRAQTAKANDRMRELCKDDEWFGKHIEKSLASQDFRRTDCERAVEQELERRGVHFEIQRRFGRYHADFYLPEKNTIIEVDGWNHRLKRQKEKDAKRDHYLQGLGLTVIHLTDKQVRADLKAACDAVQRVDGT